MDAAPPVLSLLEFAGVRAYEVGSAWMVSFVELAVAAWSTAVFLFLARRFAPNAAAPRLVAAGAVFAATWLVPAHYVRAFPIWSAGRRTRPTITTT